MRKCGSGILGSIWTELKNSPARRLTAAPTTEWTQWSMQGHWYILLTRSRGTITVTQLPWLCKNADNINIILKIPKKFKFPDISRRQYLKTVCTLWDLHYAIVLVLWLLLNHNADNFEQAKENKNCVSILEFEFPSYHVNILVSKVECFSIPAA